MGFIHLSNPEHGWIELTLVGKSGSSTICASDVPNDCLRDLLVATALLCKGSHRETVEFSLEPDFAICDLKRDGDQLLIQMKLPKQCDPIFLDTVSFTSFVKQLCAEIERIKPFYSADEGWAQPYPEEVIARLKA